MFGLLLRSELLQGSAVRTWNCFINIANFFRYKFNILRQPVMPRSRRRHHSRSRSRSHSPHDRDVKRRRVDSPDTHSRRSVSVDNEIGTPTKTSSPVNTKNDAISPKEQLQIDGVPPKETSPEHIQLDDVPPQPISPSPGKVEYVTPKKTLSHANMQKRLESEKKRKEQQMEREKKRAEERKLRQEKEDQRRKEKEEKEEARRKEREEKEEARRKEKEEREEAKRKLEEQKKKEREEKEEARRKEKEEKEELKRKIEEHKKEREEQKRKEREDRELKRQQEIHEKNRDKKKKEEQQEKTKAAFVNFFVTRKSAGAVELKKPEEKYAFIPFEIKSDMRVAPLVRRNFSYEEKVNLVDKLTKQLDTVLYLDELKRGKIGTKTTRTWPIGEDDDDVIIIEDIGERVEEHVQATKMRTKLLKFHLNRRPAYFGTWRKKSKHVTPRKPFALDTAIFDYEVDSDDDWEEEEPGESLSDDEDKANESVDDYEVDNEFFVPHGYLSGDEDADDDDDKALNPETQKAKLQLLQMEFDEEMKSKTERIKPRLIGCIWENKLLPKVQDAINTFLNAHTMIVNASITIQKRDLLNTSVKINAKTTPKRKKVTQEARNAIKQK